MWLLELQTLKRILKAEEEGFMPTEEHVARHLDLCASSGSSGTRIMSVAGDKAEIAIQGALTKNPDFMAMLFGGGNTTYTEINASLAAAEMDDEISEIIFNIDSPGGQVNGLFETLDNIRDAKKPTRAVISGNALSAAYAIAAQTDKIVAINQAASVGSIGVAIDTFVFEHEVSIASTDAPNKRPDLNTEAGKDIVRERLDSLHELFVEGIAAGRSNATGKTFTPRDINKDFGRGAILVARDGIKRGMVDSITNEGPKLVIDSPEKDTSSVNGKINTHRSKEIDKAKSTNKEGKMDLATLVKEHPALFEEAKAKGFDEGFAKGEEAERDRASAHLIFGEQSGAMKEAVEAVKTGTKMDQTTIATYMTAGMNNADIKKRDGDDGATTTALGGAATDGGEPDAHKIVADAFCKSVGYEEKGAN